LSITTQTPDGEREEEEKEEEDEEEDDEFFDARGPPEHAVVLASLTYFGGCT
jgi:hypothetical protein